MKPEESNIPNELKAMLSKYPPEVRKEIMKGIIIAAQKKIEARKLSKIREEIDHQIPEKGMTLEEYLNYEGEKRKKRMAEIKERWDTMTPEEQEEVRRSNMPEKRKNDYPHID